MWIEGWRDEGFGVSTSSTTNPPDTKYLRRISTPLIGNVGEGPREVGLYLTAEPRG